MKLIDILESPPVPPSSPVPSSKKAQKIRKLIRSRFALRRKLRDVAHRKNGEYIEEPEVFDFMNLGVDNGPTAT